MCHRLAAIVALAAFCLAAATAGMADEKKKPGHVIKVLEATYGGNCPGVARGNVTQFVSSSCNDSNLCNYRVYYKSMDGDPAEGCAKDFRVTYSCGARTKPETCALPAEAGMGGEEGQPNQFCLMHCLKRMEPTTADAPRPRHAAQPSPASPQWQSQPVTEGRGFGAPEQRFNWRSDSDR